MFFRRKIKKNGGNFQKANKKQFLIFSLRKKICVRMSKTGKDIACPLFSGKGSLTVEAALILPLFLLSSLTILSFIDVMRMSIERQMQQQEILRQGAVYANLLETAVQGREGDYLKLNYIQTVKLPIGGFGYKRVSVRQKGLIHIFNGYDDSCGDNVGWQQEYVYVTKHGTVYHKRRSCQSLNVNVRQVSGMRIKQKRNSDGKIYRACSYCIKGFDKHNFSSSSLFVTDYGVNFHVRINCPELTRTVQVIKIEQAGGKRACRLCG